MYKPYKIRKDKIKNLIRAQLGNNLQVGPFLRLIDFLIEKVESIGVAQYKNGSRNTRTRYKKLYHNRTELPIF